MNPSKPDHGSFILQSYPPGGGSLVSISMRKSRSERSLAILGELFLHRFCQLFVFLVKHANFYLARLEDGSKSVTIGSQRKPGREQREAGKVNLPLVVFGVTVE